jgi:hypothetical protein
MVLATPVLVVGCGGDERPPEESRQEVAAVVNAMRAALLDGDADGACGYMSERGQRIFLRGARNSNGLTGPFETCEQAVASSLEGVTEVEIDRYREADVKAGDVVLGDYESTDDDAEAERAQVYCPSRGAYSAELVDGEWKVLVPFCID